MISEKDISVSEISPLVPNEFFKIINREFTSIIFNIASDYGLNYNEIMQKYSNDISKIGVKFGVKKRNRRVLPSDKQCMGRKLDGEQCTRGRKEHSEYCKSHSEKRQYGRIDEPFDKEIKPRGRKKNVDNGEYILTCPETIDGETYLVDPKTSFVYSYNLSNPSFIGIKSAEGLINKIENMISVS